MDMDMDMSSLGSDDISSLGSDDIYLVPLLSLVLWHCHRNPSIVDFVEDCDDACMCLVILHIDNMLNRPRPR